MRHSVHSLDRLAGLVRFLLDPKLSVSLGQILWFRLDQRYLLRALLLIGQLVRLDEVAATEDALAALGFPDKRSKVVMSSEHDHIRQAVAGAFTVG